MKKILFAGILFCLLIPFPGLSQAKNDISVNVQDPKKIKIDFFADKEIGSVLVMISDTLGQTIHMENRDRFKGSYSQTFDLWKQKKGTYLVEVSRDADYYKTKCVLK
jgi:hypothetical protein